MAKISTLEVVFSCDGGDCRERFSYSEVIATLNHDCIELRAFEEVMKRGWKKHGGCLYCSACAERIFG